MNLPLLYSTGAHVLLLVLLAACMGVAPAKKQATYTIDFIGSSQQAMRFGEAAPAPTTSTASEPAKTENEIKTPPPPKPAPKPKQPAYNAKAQVTKTPAPKKAPTKPAPKPAPPKEERVVLGKPSVLGGAVDAGNLDPSAAHSLEDGAAGQNAVKASFTNFPYPWYITLVRNALWNEWEKRMPRRAGLSTLVSFTIDKNGGIYGVQIAQPSGNEDYDYAAISAANNSGPYPPLPKEFARDILTVTVEFKNVD